MLVWTDLETTGLDPRKESILEVAAIVTNDTFDEVTRFHRVVHFVEARTIVQRLAGTRALDEDIEVEYEKTGKKFGISPYVVRMHDVNGLWKECVNGSDISVVDDDFATFIREHAQTPDGFDEYGNAKIVKPQLAGSTISFDREFMRCWLPRSLDELHYRNLDVSTLNEIARRHWPTLHATRPNNETKAHRGMADIEESIRVLKHYMKYLMPAVLP